MTASETPRNFTPLRLHHYSEDAWAVVERPAGAIVRDQHEKLLFRLSRRDADRLADAMNAAVRDQKSVFQAIQTICKSRDEDAPKA